MAADPFPIPRVPTAGPAGPWPGCGHLRGVGEPGRSVLHRGTSPSSARPAAVAELPCRGL